MVPSAGPRCGRGAGQATRCICFWPRSGVVPAGPSDVSLGLRAVRPFGVLDFRFLSMLSGLVLRCVLWRRFCCVVLPSVAVWRVVFFSLVLCRSEVLGPLSVFVVLPRGVSCFARCIPALPLGCYGVPSVVAYKV